MRKVPQRMTEVSSSGFKTLGVFVQHEPAFFKCQSSADEVGESCKGFIITELVVNKGGLGRNQSGHRDDTT